MKILKGKCIPETPEEARRLEKQRFEYKQKVMYGEAGGKYKRLKDMGSKPEQLTLDDIKTRRLAEGSTSD